MKIILAVLLFITTAYSQTDSTFIAVSDSIITDSLKIVDTLFTHHVKPLCESSYFINTQTIMKTDYRYTGDILTLFPFTFIRNTGFVGMPAEINIYGAGYRRTSYMENGLIINNRNKNIFDVNFFQSEDIDSVEIVPLPRGFLQGLNNDVTVNFITKDFIPPAPYSRVKYYEGPWEEAMIDFQFATLFFKKIIFMADISNRKTGESYTNSSFSQWQGKFKMKYLLANNINLFANYFYNKSNVSLNGGVDVDSIKRYSSNIDKIMYDEIAAPVLFYDRYRKTSVHNFYIMMIGNFLSNTQTDFSAYYQTALEEDRAGESQNIFIGEDYRYKTTGALLKQNFSFNYFELNFSANYEKTEHIYNFSLFRKNSNFLNLSSIVSTNKLFGSIKPSFFINFKRFDYSGDLFDFTSSGWGGDVSWKLNDEFDLYLGFNNSYVTLKQSGSYPSGSGLQKTNFEFKVNYKGKGLTAGASFFLSNDEKINPNEIIYGSPLEIFSPIKKKISGIGLLIDYAIWKIHFNNQFTYYKNYVSENLSPTFYNKTKIYYSDILFDSNLVLNTGFVLNTISNQTMFKYDYDYGADLFNTIGEKIPSSFQIDFTLAGEIQKVATVYFVWENLLDREYYLVPYFPMPRRGIRFGIAWEFLN